MGFFSWKTQDTNRSISNDSSKLGTFKVFMLDYKGNKWIENSYEGYGYFGGKDFYELLAEMNGVVERDKVQLQGQEYTEYMRIKGIDLVFEGNSSGDNTPGVIYPNLVESENLLWVNEGPETCEFQGYFYEFDQDDEDV